jgi:hypothetical protein
MSTNWRPDVPFRATSPCLPKHLTRKTGLFRGQSRMQFDAIAMWTFLRVLYASAYVI